MQRAKLNVLWHEKSGAIWESPDVVWRGLAKAREMPVSVIEGKKEPERRESDKNHALTFLPRVLAGIGHVGVAEEPGVFGEEALALRDISEIGTEGVGIVLQDGTFGGQESGIRRVCPQEVGREFPSAILPERHA